MRPGCPLKNPSGETRMPAEKPEWRNPDAEAFSSYTLKIPEGEALRVENNNVYGVKKNSRYVKAPIARGEI